MKRARRIHLALPALAVGPGRPLWRAVEAALAWQIDIGYIAAGARLPSTRTLARQLGISRNTTTLAYESLIADGYLASRVGDGTYALAQTSRRQGPLWQRRRRWLRDSEGLLMSLSL